MSPTQVGDHSRYGIKWPGASSGREGLAHKQAGVACHLRSNLSDELRAGFHSFCNNVVTAAAIRRQGSKSGKIQKIIYYYYSFLGVYGQFRPIHTERIK